MSDTLQRPNPRVTLGEMVASFRIQAGLTQSELALLTIDLADQELVTHSIAQQSLSRIEKSTDALHSTLVVIATSLAYQFALIGQGDFTEDFILRQLLNTKKAKIRSYDVSEEAARLDALIAVFPKRYRSLLWKIIFGIIEASQKEMEEQRREARNESP